MLHWLNEKIRFDWEGLEIVEQMAVALLPALVLTLLLLVILFFPALLCTGHLRFRCRRMREMYAEERRSVHYRERRGQWFLRARGADFSGSRRRRSKAKEEKVNCHFFLSRRPQRTPLRQRNTLHWLEVKIFWDIMIYYSRSSSADRTQNNKFRIELKIEVAGPDDQL